jgi:nucleotide-binding universal stress UspA family protein
MIAIRSILCPYDGSEFSRRALEHATALARFYGAGLTLLHVHTGAPVGPDADRLGWDGPLLARERKRIVAWLADIGGPARAAAVGVEAKVVEGTPAAEILRVAREAAAGLVVMGTHGRSGFDRLLLGSVTEKVLRYAPCPVLTVTARAVPDYVPERAPFQRIVCPVDFSHASQRAVEYALTLAQEACGRLTLLHALEALPAEEEAALSRFDITGFHQTMERIARSRLQEAIPRAARDWCRPEFHLGRGKAYQVILEAAEERDADLIVIGNHGRTPIEAVLFGSTTHHVVRAARCPVLVARADA